MCHFPHLSSSVHFHLNHLNNVKCEKDFCFAKDSEGQFGGKIWCARVSLWFCIKWWLLHRVKLKIHLESQGVGGHSGYYFISINLIIKDLWGLPCVTRSLHSRGRVAYQKKRGAFSFLT